MKVTDEGIEVYFSDLNLEAQKMLLKALLMKDEEEGNFEIVPIAILIPEKLMEE